MASRLLCTNQKQITKVLQDTVNKGGEGIILRKVRSLYERGRSLLLFKLKVINVKWRHGILMVFQNR